jgi:DNA-binding transcriptional LysR family regulator
MIAMIADGRGIATMPGCHAEILIKVLPMSVAVPVSDARPVELVLAGREDRRNPLVDALRAAAARIG